MELISYAVDFVSFLLQNLNESEREEIKSVLLFGSSARGEARKESDIDIFVDIISNNERIEKKIKKINKEFFDSVKYTKYWKLLDVENDFHIIVGKINE